MRPDGRVPVVGDAMLRTPRTSAPWTTVADARRALEDPHLHALLVVERGMLLTVVERPDLVSSAPGQLPAVRVGRRGGRVVAPHAALEPVRVAMRRAGRRRLAVVDDAGTLLGLLCLKGSGTGVCSASDVAARAAERGRSPYATATSP